MRFIFVRHGHYDGKGKPPPVKKRMPLNARGREAARAAGEFLRREGIVPDVVITTDAERTQETARLLLDALDVDDVSPRAAGSGFGGRGPDLDPKLDQWLAEIEPLPDTVLFVGHVTSQSHCLGKLGAPPAVPGDNRSCVLIYERGPDHRWTCVESFPGLAP